MVRSSETQVVGHGALGSTPSTTDAEPPVCSAGAKAVPRTVIILMGSEDWTVRIALPAYIGRTKAAERLAVEVEKQKDLMRKLRSGWAYCLRFQSL